MRLEELGEFGLIARLRRRWQDQRTPGVIVGPGDDAAVLSPPSPGSVLLLTTDTMVENVHFRRRWISPQDLGWKAMVQNLSDIAAMGGQPRHAVVTVGAPADVDVEFMDSLVDGTNSAAQRYGAAIVGGDLVRSHGPLFVSISLTGQARGDQLLRRSAARPGQALLVTGELGASAAGLAALERGEGARFPAAAHAHLRPEPRLEAAAILASQRLSACAIDISDGLASDATRLAEESGVGIRIDLASIPIAHSCREVAEWLGADAAEMALRGGEDYELLFAVNCDRVDEAKRLLRHQTGVVAYQVGEVTEKEQGLVAVKPDGTVIPLGTGHDHFAADK